MKKIKNTSFQKWKLILAILMLSFSTAYGAEKLSDEIGTQDATQNGSNNSLVQFYNDNDSYDANYYNQQDNSTIIGNFLEWFYYDSLYGMFEMDWSTEQDNNVRIISSTPACATGYWYKFWWYAKSDMIGLINFNFSDSTYVYYCEDDQMLHGYAYSAYAWFQSFEWIQFTINPTVEEVETATWSTIFLNDTTKISQPNIWNQNTNTFIGWDIIELDDDKETIFYIIK